MSSPSHIARENGKKGGRPKGSKGTHTLVAEKAREFLINEIAKDMGPIVQAQKEATQATQTAVNEARSKNSSTVNYAIKDQNGKVTMYKIPANNKEAIAQAKARGGVLNG